MLWYAEVRHVDDLRRQVVPSTGPSVQKARGRSKRMPDNCPRRAPIRREQTGHILEHESRRLQRREKPRDLSKEVPAGGPRAVMIPKLREILTRWPSQQDVTRYLRNVEGPYVALGHVTAEILAVGLTCPRIVVVGPHNADLPSRLSAEVKPSCARK
jgi:hypothetical protein